MQNQNYLSLTRAFGFEYTPTGWTRTGTKRQKQKQKNQYGIHFRNGSQRNVCHGRRPQPILTDGNFFMDQVWKIPTKKWREGDCGWKHRTSPSSPFLVHFCMIPISCPEINVDHQDGRHRTVTAEHPAESQCSAEYTVSTFCTVALVSFFNDHCNVVHRPTFPQAAKNSRQWLWVCLFFIAVFPPCAVGVSRFIYR